MTAPDRALRRLVARLATLQDVDRQTVLDSLSPDQAREIARLIGDYRGETPPGPLTAFASPWAGLGLSPVLAQRLEGDSSDLRIPAAERSFGEMAVSLTPLTLSTLRRLAGDLEPIVSAPLPPATSARPGLLERLGFRGWRS
jgi:hypothetical protein